MYLYPHWGPKEPDGVQSSLCVHVYVFLSVYLYVSLSSHPCRFLEIICTARNCAQRIWPQATGSDSLSGNIIFPYVRTSVRPVVREPFTIFYLYSIVLILEMININITITSVGVQHSDAFIPTLGSVGLQWGPVAIICLSICLSVCLSVRSSPSIFGKHLQGA